MNEKKFRAWPIDAQIQAARHCEEHLRRSNPSRHEKKKWIASLRSQ
jgi:hypothetical protein